MSNQGTAPKPHWWQRKESIIAFAIIGTLVLIAALIFAAHTYHWDVTTTTTTEMTQSPQQKVTTTETGKTLLDWLQLLGVLAIPIVVVIGTAFFGRQQTKIGEANRTQQHNTEMQIAENQQQEEADLPPLGLRQEGQRATAIALGLYLVHLSVNAALGPQWQVLFERFCLQVAIHQSTEQDGVSELGAADAL